MADETKENSDRQKRDFVGVTFSCCNIYLRVYLEPGRERNYGWCPKCGGRIEILVTEDGSDQRFFTAQ